MQFPHVLETDRLIVRGWKPGDVEAFYAICSDPAVMRFVGDGTPWSRERTQAFLDRATAMMQARGFCQWPVVRKGEGELVGFCGFVPCEEGAEIGWRLAPTMWGRGFATEAARAVLQYGFDLFGFPRVLATVQPSNSASVRVIEKLGLSYREARFRQGREIHVYSRQNPAAQPGPTGEAS